MKISSLGVPAALLLAAMALLPLTGCGTSSETSCESVEAPSTFSAIHNDSLIAIFRAGTVMLWEKNEFFLTSTSGRSGIDAPFATGTLDGVDVATAKAE